jgi:tetratricopeptide (TPR) repeat protein
MLGCGRFVEAVGLLERAAEVSRAFAFRDMLVTALTPLAAAYAHTGRAADARVIVDASPLSGLRASFRNVRLADAALAARALPQAREHAERALVLSRSQNERGEEAWSLYLLGAIEAHGESASVTVAEAHYLGSLARAEELGMRPLVAHCHLGLGQLYARTGKRGKAREHLATAATMCREMDMRFWLEQAEAAMRSLG